MNEDSSVLPSGILRLTAPTRVVYGKPCAEAILDEVNRRDARRVFVVTTAALGRRTDEIERIRAKLGARCAGAYDQIAAHAPTDAVVQASALARDAQADLLVAVGGSSVTDACKILAICLRHGLTTVEQLEPYHFFVDCQGQTVFPEFAAPTVGLVAVPTTLSGSEFTSIAAGKNRHKNIKEGYRHHALAPEVVIFDPAITLHTPDWLWLSSGVRALDHALETLGSLQSNDFCDGIAASALDLLSRGLTRVKAERGDLQARLQCQFGLWQSMLPGAAGVPMGISHAIGHVLGGLLGVPHGYTSCVMAAAALRYNEPFNSAQQRRIAAILGQPQREAGAVVDTLIRQLGLPHTLAQVGVEMGQFDAIARECMKEPWIYTNPRPIGGTEDIVDILTMAA